MRLHLHQRRRVGEHRRVGDRHDRAHVVHRRLARVVVRVPVLRERREQQLRAERAERAHALLNGGRGPRQPRDIEPDHPYRPPRAENDRRRLGVGPDVVFRGVVDVAPRRGTAHDHEVPDPGRQPRLAAQRQRDVGQRARGDQRDLPGCGGDRFDDEIDGMPVLGGPHGRRQDRAAEAGVTVYVSRVERRAQQRRGAPGGHRYVWRADERRHRQGIPRRLGQPDSAGHGREAGQLDLRRGDREGDCERVVDAGIAVEDDGGAHGEILSGRPPGETARPCAGKTGGSPEETASTAALPG